MKNIIKVLAALLISIPAGLQTKAQVSVGLSIRVGPPALPVYTQPLCPGDGYIWVPGYWAYANNDYYWVPGTWILPPQVGLLWTPGYWGFSGGYYGWHSGYWGHHVGFYGGINYGFGYGGVGYGGGMWRGNAFHYNTAVNNVNTTVVHNTYVDKTVINNTTIVNNRKSYNGQGGVMAKPGPQEQLAAREQHVQPTSEQLSHETSARADRSQFASANHGRPEKLAVNTGKNNNNNNNNNNNSNNNSNNDNNVETVHRADKQQSRDVQNNDSKQNVSPDQPANNNENSVGQSSHKNLQERPLQNYQQQLKNNDVNAKTYHRQNNHSHSQKRNTILNKH